MSAASLVRAVVEGLEQASALLEDLEPTTYARPHELTPSGPGGHVRHCLDFCLAFLEGLPGRRVDYERRERDPRTEVDPSHARRRIAALVSRLEALESIDPDVPLLVRAEGPAEGRRWSHSSVGRELEFLVSHTIHHWALVALALRLAGVEPGAEFGVAPSTLRHWSRTGAPAGRFASAAG